MVNQNFEENIEVAEALLDEIIAVSNNGVALIRQDEFKEFQVILENRQQKIEHLTELRNTLTNWIRRNCSESEKDAINSRLNMKIDKLTKVDRKLYDIMNRKKKELKDQMDRVTQGKNFLKCYKNQLHSNQVIHETL